MTGPLDYSLCSQTVTLYRNLGKRISRLVVDGCYYTWQEEQVIDDMGSRRETLCLLIMPGDTQRVFVGDRVFEGIGPEIEPEDWTAFIPVTVPGLAEISYVKPCRWDGRLCHVEAGRK